MNFQWENPNDRLLRFMKISPQQKMEWLHQMHGFMLRTSSKKLRNIRLKLRKQRQGIE